MKYKRILFIRASLSHAWVGATSPPVGIAYLVEALRKYSCECRTIDTALGGYQDVCNVIAEFRPDVIGISMLTYRYCDVYKMINTIKDRCPNIPIIVGGAHVSTLREEVLRSCKAIDYGFVGESEESIVEFCQGGELSQIKGIISRRNGDIVYSGDRKPILNLDAVSWPKDYGVDLDRYLSKERLILSSRGCPYSCIFCPVSLAIGKKLRVRSAENVVDEMEYWYKRGYRRFAMLDDNFTFYKERTIEICDKIKDRGLKDLIIRCGNGIRCDKVDKEVLEKMKGVGFTYVSYGVESGNDRVLKTLKKGETIKQIEKAIELSLELGFDVTLFFVVGTPSETVKDVEDSIRVALKYPIVDVRFYNLIPYPGTELFRWVQENNAFVRQPEDYLNDTSGVSGHPVFETPELPFPTRVKLMKRLNKIEKKVRKNAIRNKLKKFGWIGTFGYYLLGNIYGTNFFQALIRQNKLIRRIGENIYFKISVRRNSAPPEKHAKTNGNHRDE